MVLKMALRIAAFWQKAQVEFHGQYSLMRLTRFNEYSKQTSWQRMLGVILVAPLPCLIAILAFEMIQLKPPEAGAKANWGFWLRLFGTNSVTSLTTMLLFHRMLSLPPLNMLLVVISTALTNVIPTLFGYGLAQLIGFPVPFILHLVLPSWILGASLSTVIVFKPYRDQFSTLKPRAIECSKMAIISGIAPFIYPVYFYIFRQLSSSYQGLFSLILPAMKIVLKNAMSHFIHIHSDLRPEEIVFTIELFTSLFATFSLQSTSSFLPIILLTGIDITLACISLCDILSFGPTLELSWRKLKILEADNIVASPNANNSTKNLIEDLTEIMMQLNETSQQQVPNEAQHRSEHPKRIIPVNQQQKKFPASRTVTLGHFRLPPKFSASAIIPGPDMSFVGSRDMGSRIIFSNANNELLARKKEFGLEILRFLHATEYIVLVEFTKVIVPTIYALYLSVAFRLPNHKYYPQLEGVSRLQQHTLMASIFIYASVELTAFVLVTFIVWTRLHFLLFKQLAFVLDTQWRYVQSKLVLWVLYVIQCSLVHFGVDYSFRFAWLCSPTS